VRGGPRGGFKSRRTPCDNYRNGEGGQGDGEAGARRARLSVKEGWRTETGGEGGGVRAGRVEGWVLRGKWPSRWVWPGLESQPRAALSRGLDRV
jgi:hypothetical protein